MTTDPLTLFQAVADAMEREDWQGAAALCDPASLLSFRRQTLRGLEPPDSIRGLTVEQYLKHQPDMPREVAEYQIAQHRKHFDPAWRLREEFPGVDGMDALRRLGAEELFATWLRGRLVRGQLERAAREGGLSEAKMEDVLATVRPPLRYRAIGAVESGPLGFVLFEYEIAPPRPDELPETDYELEAELAQFTPAERELAEDLAHGGHPHVAICRRQPDGTWRMLADHGFLGQGTFVMAIDDEGPESGPRADGASG